MNTLTSLGSTIFQAVTGTDPSAISSQLSAAENQLVLAVEVVIALLALMVVGELFILLELRRG
jgi:hypothetical protein